MHAIAHSTVKLATRRVATVALIALAAIATAPTAMATESPAVQTTTKAVADLLTPLGHTWGN